MTIQNPPPTLEQDSGSKHFSKHMREMVQLCLNKDPAKRPTAAKLLEHKFFKVIYHLQELDSTVKLMFHVRQRASILQASRYLQPSNAACAARIRCYLCSSYVIEVTS